MAVDFDALANAPVLAALGQPVIYTPVAAPGFNLIGVFDRHASTVSFGADGVPTSTVAPQLSVRLADFIGGPDPAPGDWVQVQGLLLRVVDIQPDGLGGLRLVLGNRADQGV